MSIKKKTLIHREGVIPEDTDNRDWVSISHITDSNYTSIDKPHDVIFDKGEWTSEEVNHVIQELLLPAFLKQNSKFDELREELDKLRDTVSRRNKSSKRRMKRLKELGERLREVEYLSSERKHTIDALSAEKSKLLRRLKRGS